MVNDYFLPFGGCFHFVDGFLWNPKSYIQVNFIHFKLILYDVR